MNHQIMYYMIMYMIKPISFTKQLVHLTFKNNDTYTISAAYIRSFAGLLQTPGGSDGSNTYRGRYVSIVAFEQYYLT